MRNTRQNYLVGASVDMVNLRQEIARVARSDAKVLITGESGVGKELVAQAIHGQSRRLTKPCLTVSCAGLPETILESELFGHVMGSFVGAHHDRPGKLELADEGTIFLDEVAEMTPRLQGLLLRFVETGELQKVGADRVLRSVDVRMIASTTCNLRDMVARGAFREDLLYRLNVIHLEVAPLRHRKEDIPILASHFVEYFTQQSSEYIPRALSADAMALLCNYSWPGNVRELENVVERLVVTGRWHTIQPSDLPDEIRFYKANPNGSKSSVRNVADDLYKRLIEEGQSFWSVVYPLYMQREITRGHVRDVVRMGLEEARGNYKIVARLFNLEPTDYKRFLNFLRKHECHLPFKEYR